MEACPATFHLFHKPVESDGKECLPVLRSADLFINEFVRKQLLFYYKYLSLSSSWRMNKLTIIGVLLLAYQSLEKKYT